MENVFKSMNKVPMWARMLIVIVVGIFCWARGWSIYQNNLAASNLDAVTSDLINMAARAQQHYHRPTAMGGGGDSFALLTADDAGLAYITTQPTNENGDYSISAAGSATTVTIQGIGTEDGDGDGTPCTAQVQVWPDSLSVIVINR